MHTHTHTPYYYTCLNECFRNEWIRRKFDLESNMKLSKSIDRADGNCLLASCCSDEIVGIHLEKEEDNEKNYRREKKMSSHFWTE